VTKTHAPPSPQSKILPTIEKAAEIKDEKIVEIEQKKEV